MGKYFQEDIETASREQINQWQNDRLLDVVKRVYENVPFYRKKMEAVGVTPDKVEDAVRDQGDIGLACISL